MSLYARAVRPMLFAMEAERAHRLALAACRAPLASDLLERACRFDDARLAVTAGGLRFANPVALGAGFDKNGVAVRALAALGFGALEVGSVSLASSTGNRGGPRLLRLPEEEALMVWYGVPNDGAAAVRRRLDARRAGVPLGVSLVETNTGGAAAPLAEVREQLVSAARELAPVADYLALNLSCPNTVGGSGALEGPGGVAEVLRALEDLGRLPPLFLKVRPPESEAAIDALLRAVEPFASVKGFILNVHLRRPELRGALTGRPLRALVERALRQWYARIDRSRHVLVAAGGVSDAEDAWRYIRLGASLVQLVTALVYRGPGVVQEIKRGLAARVEREGLTDIAQAIGAGL